jgi:hypothetical protein
VQEALDELRSKLGEGEKIDFAELLTLGARAKTRTLSLEEAQRSASLKRLAEKMRTRSFPYELDVAAADEVKRVGLIAKYE